MVSTLTENSSFATFLPLFYQIRNSCSSSQETSQRSREWNFGEPRRAQESQRVGIGIAGAFEMEGLGVARWKKEGFGRAKGLCSFLGSGLKLEEKKRVEYWDGEGRSNLDVVVMFNLLHHI